MKKNIIYAMIALIGVFSSCKKRRPIEDVVPIIPIETPIPNSFGKTHLVAVTNSNGFINEYGYNQNNKLNSVKYYSMNAQSVKVLDGEESFIYDAYGRLLQKLEILSPKFKYVYDYKFEAGVLKNLVESTVNSANPSTPVTTVNSIYSYGYSNGQISEIDMVDGKGKSVMHSSYQYGTNGENPTLTITQTPTVGAPSSISYEWYNGVVDPISFFVPYSNPFIASKLVLKSYSTTSGSGSQIYESDILGRLKSLTISTNFGNVNTQSYTYTGY